MNHCCQSLPSRRLSRNIVTAVGHTVTAVMGAGVLNLPYATAVLGWVGGPISILVFSYITLYTSYLLADCHVYKSQRLRTYTDVVFATFGHKGFVAIGW